MKDIREGGCLCGAVRYEIDLSGHETGNCHCRDCQKNCGAPFVTSTFVPESQFRWITKPSGEYSASPAAIRRFCAQCGTPLQWDGFKLKGLVDINTATLDDTPMLKCHTKYSYEAEWTVFRLYRECLNMKLLPINRMGVIELVPGYPLR